MNFLELGKLNNTKVQEYNINNIYCNVYDYQDRQDLLLQPTANQYDLL